MFIEHRTYTVKPGKLGEYLATYGRDGWPLHSAHAPCLGHYYTEAGELFRMISLWRYESFEDRLERRAALNADPRWQKAMAQISPLVTDIRSNLVVPTPCWKDDDWYRVLYAQFDAMRMEGFLGWLTDDVELTIFDLTYTTGGGKHSHTHRQTIIRFASSQLNLPDFTVSPEWFFHKIAKLFGVKDINFPEDPAFSSAFLLQGERETAVRDLFSTQIREWFSARKGITAAGRDQQLFFFRAEQRVNPDKIAGLLEEGFQFFKLLAKPVADSS